MKKTFIHVIIASLWYLPRKTALTVMWYIRFRTKLDLGNPTTFNEKLQFCILYRYGKLEEKCADKLRVREYLQEKGISNISVPLLHVYDNPNDIDFSALPSQFVLKTNHGCGTNIICRNKEELDESETKMKLKKWLKHNYARDALEYHYSEINPIILCEEYIGEADGEVEDIKIHCFNGKPVGILYCSDRMRGLKLNWYDLEWNEIEDYIVDEYRGRKKVTKPQQLDKMIEIANKLSESFVFVRVDFYNLDNRVLLSELTFTPEAGRIDYFTDKAQTFLGDCLEL